MFIWKKYLIFASVLKLTKYWSNHPWLEPKYETYFIYQDGYKVLTAQICKCRTRVEAFFFFFWQLHVLNAAKVICRNIKKLHKNKTCIDILKHLIFVKFWSLSFCDFKLEVQADEWSDTYRQTDSLGRSKLVLNWTNVKKKVAQM